MAIRIVGFGDPRATDFAVGCYCGGESHCHRGILRELLSGRGVTLHQD